MMNRLKALAITTIGFAAANIAVSDDGSQHEPQFANPRYNIMDDLNDYGGDYRWPEQAPGDQTVARTGGEDDAYVTQTGEPGRDRRSRCCEQFA